MSNTQNKASWASISGFGGVVKNEATAFSEGTGGSRFEVGTHKDLLIKVVEPRMTKTNKPFLMLTIAAEDGRESKWNVFLTKMDDKAGNPQDGFSVQYQQLGVALVKDPELRMKAFGKHFPSNPEALQGLVGMRLTASFVDGKNGYIVQESPTGGKVLIDSETGKEYPEFKGQVFEDYSDIKEAAKEIGVYARKPEVKRVSQPSDELLAANEEAISAVLRATEAKGGPATPTASRAARPRTSI